MHTKTTGNVIILLTTLHKFSTHKLTSEDSQDCGGEESGCSGVRQTLCLHTWCLYTWLNMIVYMIAYAIKERSPNLCYCILYLTITCYTQSWKGMLGGDSFVKAGWVHALKAHLFRHTSGCRWLVMGKVSISITLLLHTKGKTLPENDSISPISMGCNCMPAEWRGKVLIAHRMAGWANSNLAFISIISRVREACSPIAAVISSLIWAAQV